MKNISGKIYFLSALILLIVNNIAIASASEQFEKANKSYRSGEYEDAIKQYELLIKSGYYAEEIYYNNGNCYYKLQDFPSAILNFERAKRINPVDEDVTYNLKLSYANTIDKIEPIPLLFYERWTESILFSLSPSTWSWIAVIVMWIALSFSIWYLFATSVSDKKRSFLTSGTFLIVAIMLFAIASCSDKKLNGQKAAIVMEANTYIKSSPDSKSTNLFMLHGGTKIEVIDEINGWLQIRIANGNLGWVDEKTVEII